MRHLRFAVCAALVLVACGPPPLPWTPWVPELTPRAEKFARLDPEVPSYGGLARSGSVWTVYTRDPDRQTEAAQVIANIFAEPGDDVFTVGVRPARGSATRDDFRRAVNSMGRIEMIVSADHDELTGYVRIGVYDPDGVVSAQEVLTEAEVSLEVVILDVVYPVVPL